MGFWLPAAILLVGVIGVIAFALFQRRQVDIPVDERELAREFYQQQVAELNQSLALGKIDDAGFAAAKLELDRELLRQSKEAKLQAGGASNPLLLILPLVITLAVAVPAYIYLGNPEYGDRPLAERIAAGENIDLDDAMQRIEAHLANNPDDIQGWRVIAPVYMRIGAFNKAVIAFKRISEIEGETAESLTNIAEALISANDGNLIDEARNALERAAEIDPKHVRSRFYLAAEATREGRNEEAAERWRALLALAQGNEAWLETAQAGLAEATNGQEGATGPTEDDVNAAAEMSAEDRSAMISNMVAGLKERLYAEGGSPAEWAQLLRAQLVLKDNDAANASLEKAKAQFANDPQLLAQFEQAAANEIKELEGDQ